VPAIECSQRAEPLCLCVAAASACSAAAARELTDPAVRLLQDPSPARRSAAEQALLEFRRSGSVEQCVSVLQQSGEEAAQFQASAVLLGGGGPVAQRAA
jgi:hypothetical protein